MKKKYFLGDLLSVDFWQKICERNKIAMKMFSRNYKLYVPPPMYKINSHIMNGVRS